MNFERVAKLGAEVSGIELSPDLAQAVIDEIEKGILEHRVLFFRDQGLNGEELVEFSRRFGESFIQPALAHKYQELLFLENDKSKPPTLNTFHQDMTGLAQPPALHMLHALVVPAGEDPPANRPQVAVRQPLLHQFHQRLHSAGKRKPAGVPFPAHRNSRILRAAALAPRHAGDLGQSLHFPLRAGRLLAAAPQDAARLRLRRHPLLGAARPQAACCASAGLVERASSRII